jgi:alkylation response protein AidB-like acyl-CoA dehydrogenase
MKTMDIQDIPFEKFLNDIKARMKTVFHERANIDQMSLHRGMPPFVMREIMNLSPLSVGIPEMYGGRGCKMEENMALLEATSYESLALSLTLGINLALFLQPVAKYGQEEIKQSIFNRFLFHRNMGGLMITEPGYGSDALNLQTHYTEHSDNYELKGLKHWAGLTGQAEYWLLAARERMPSGELKRDIGFFICDETSPRQQIIVEEVFSNLGLYQIPYGRNRIDVRLPKTHKLIPKSTGLKMMQDLLHRSRMHIPGMAIGFVKRMLDESIAHVKQRHIGGKSLFSHDQVQHRLARLQSFYTICAAMCAHSCKTADIKNDLSMSGFEANAVKCVATDIMQESAQSATQLFGASGFKLDHIAGRGIIDSRPFQIFEGPNDILYAQITGNLLKMMKQARESNLYRFLKDFNLTSKSAAFFKKLLDFNLDSILPQRKMVELGQVVGRIVSSEMVINLRDSGYRQDLINNCLEMLGQELNSLMSGFNVMNTTAVIEDYSENSSWRNPEGILEKHTS